MNKVALIIIYNHQYNKNIDILEQIYKDRFSDVYHIVPFYNGTKKNVIPVYENSYCFQGYISQGFKIFFKEEYAHYFFIADDMILNPIINENNYTEILNLNKETCFIPDFINLHERKKRWKRVNEAYSWDIKVRGVEAENQLPKYNDALQLFNNFDLKISPLRFDQIYKNKKAPKFYDIIGIAKYFHWKLNQFKNKNKKFNLSYPMIGSYSDICIISSDAIRQFCHYCGIFAATNLFVELAIPTSIVLSAKKIVTEKDLKLQGKALWTKEEVQELDKYNNSLTDLLRDFPTNYIYLHPIKLSKWKTEL